MKKLDLTELKALFPVAHDFIMSHDMNEIQEQRYELGNNAYVNVESYNTYSFEERKYESHKKHVDIQYIITGSENILTADVETLFICQEYNEKSDIAFYDNSVSGQDNYLQAGEVLLLEPKDGHMPCISINDSIYVKKAVFKIPVE